MRTPVRVLLVLLGTGIVSLATTLGNPGRRAQIFKTVVSAEAVAGEKTDSSLAKLRLLSRSVGYIRSNYVAPERIKPVAMLIKALKGAEGVIPEMLSTPDTKDYALARQVTVTMGNKRRTYSLAGITDLFQMTWKLMDIFQFVAANLPRHIKPEDVEYAAINGLLSPLDEHSVFLPPKAYEEMKLDTEGKFGGLGIVITTREGYITVVSVLPGTPAQRAGLRSRDKIVEIGEESALNMPLTDAVSKLRGEPGTRVRVTIQRKGWSEPRAFTITRAIIHVQTLLSRYLGHGIGYVRIRHFQEDTADELLETLHKMEKRHRIRRLILDLRQNPGGLLEEAVEVGRLFISKGVIVITEGEGKRMRQEYHGYGDVPFPKMPIVVLVDDGTASAAEIVAAALKRNGRALCMGSRTFGKGTVQVLYEVGDGALKLTVAQYLTPGGYSIHGVGIAPDIELYPIVLEGEDISLGSLAERDRERHDRKLQPLGPISHDEPMARLPVIVPPPKQYNPEEEPPIEEDNFKMDGFIETAMHVVKAMGGPDKHDFLPDVQAALARLREDRDQEIVQALARHSVDWTQGPVVKSPKLDVHLKLPNPIEAGHKYHASLVLRNRSQHTLFRVRCVTESQDSALDGLEFIVGVVRPGQTVVKKRRIKVPDYFWDRVDQVKVRVFQGMVEVGPTQHVLARVKSADRPRFEYSWQISDESGNGDGILNLGEEARLLVDVRNVGKAATGKLVVAVVNKCGDSLYVRKGRVAFKGLGRGAVRTAHFVLRLNRWPEEGSPRVKLSITDMRHRDYLEDEFDLLTAKDGVAGSKFSTEKFLKVIEPADVLEAATTNASVLYRLDPGVTVRGAGIWGDYYKVEIEPGRYGFVERRNCVEIQSIGKFARYANFPITYREEPSLDFSLPPQLGVLRAGSTLKLRGTLKFGGDISPFGRKLIVYRGEDKVFFRDLSNSQGEVSVSIPVSLEQGNNDIAVYAVDGKTLAASRRFTVFAGEMASGQPEDQRVTLSGDQEKGDSK